MTERSKRSLRDRKWWRVWRSESGAQYAAQGSGHRGQNGDGNASQISSVADSSLTGIRGLSVNNRGSVLGQPAPLQSVHFSSVALIFSVSSWGQTFSHTFGFSQWYFHQQPSSSVFFYWGEIVSLSGILLDPRLHLLKLRHPDCPKELKKRGKAETVMTSLI